MAVAPTDRPSAAATSLVGSFPARLFNLAISSSVQVRLSVIRGTPFKIFKSGNLGKVPAIKEQGKARQREPAELGTEDHRNRSCLAPVSFPTWCGE